MAPGLFALVAVAGGFGAVCRVLVDGAVRARLSSGPAGSLSGSLSGSLPLGTLAVNVSGSLLLGVVVGSLANAAAAILGAGFLGGYTTFSTASFETVYLLRGRAPWLGIAYGAGSLLISGLAAWLGLALVGAA